MLIDENDLNRVLQRRSEPIELGKAVLGEVVPSHDCTMPPRSIVPVSFDPKSLAVVVDELAEHSYARVEGDDEGD